jgi:CDP-diacylglycerol--glycerol-3-phosphate 3-phosphatidyltransferase
VGSFLGTVFAWPYRAALALVHRSGAHAWHLTVLSLLVNGAVGWLLVTDRHLLAGGSLVLAGLLDVLDGGLARLRGEAGPAGAFLDSVVDRISDLIVFGSLYWALSGQGRPLPAALALASLIAALLVSHLRAEAEAVGLSLTEGLMQRLERYVALIIGLVIPGTLVPVLVILSAFGFLTVVQRAASAWRNLEGPTSQPHAGLGSNAPEGRRPEKE